MKLRILVPTSLFVTTVTLGGALVSEGGANEPVSGSMVQPTMPATQATPPYCGCALDDGAFASQDGGCKDLQTELVWSTWSLFLKDPPAQPGYFAWDDAVAYCDSLVECGYDDWFLPSKEQAAVVLANGSASHFEWEDITGAWFSWTSSSNGQRAYMIDLQDPAATAIKVLKPSKIPCFCVRVATGPPPVMIDVYGVSPNTLPAGSAGSFTITGGGFLAGATVTFENGSSSSPTASNVVVVDPFTLTVDLSVSGAGPPGARTWDVRVTNTDVSTGVLVDGLTVFK